MGRAGGRNCAGARGIGARMTVSQTAFRHGLLDPALPAPDGLVNPDGAPATKRFDVYRNNVAVSLSDALESAFPVIRKLVGDNFDECAEAAQKFTSEKEMTFIPPFDHPKIIEGQGTVGLEIFKELPDPDYIFLPVGGGGLSAGVGTCLKILRPQVKIISIQ